MKRLFSIAFSFLAGALAAVAQPVAAPVAGSTYYLPCTALRITMLIEKTSYTPGEYAMYADKYLRRTDVRMQPEVTYRIVGMQVSTIGVPDSSRQYVARVDVKHSIESLHLSDQGVLLAVNDKAVAPQQPAPFVAAPKPAPINPRDYMSEEILKAGSSVKMAELCAQEIYDIRENRNLLNKGQADFMPKDGAQLRTMLAGLDKSEAALMQLFEGTTRTDTTQSVMTYVPTQATAGHLLFRFSKYAGLTTADDLSGTPYYIGIEDLHYTPQIQAWMEMEKRDKYESGIYVCLPGKIKATIRRGNDTLAQLEAYAAQFGRTEPLDGSLFSKKVLTRILLNPITGNIEHIDMQREK